MPSRSRNELRSPERDRLLRFYRQEHRTPEEVEAVLEIFRKCGAFDQALDACRHQYHAARQALEEISEPPLRRLLGDFLEYRVSRKLS